MNNNEDLLSGKLKPQNIPGDWLGEPLPNNQGWRWFNPNNRGDSVRIYAAAEPYVVVTQDGEVLGREGKPTGKFLRD